MLLLGQVFFGKDVLDALPCGVAVTNSLGYIILWNQHMAELTGISPHQAEGELIFRWFPELETMAVNARVPFYRSGRRVHFRVQSQAVAQGRAWAFQSEDTQVPEALQADLVSMVSHEVRVPLTSIKGFVDTLLRSRDQLNEEQQVRFLTIIKNQADRLSRLVEDLLSMARLQSGRMRNLPEGVQVRPVLERVLENLAQVSSGHSLLWEIAPDLPSVWADEDRLEQIFTNLLDNAFKYSQPGTPVTIRASVTGTFATLSIQDRGIGIEKEALLRVFDRFCHIENSLETGTGLGLYITKALVESLGGKIAVESSLGVGSTFSVALPLAPKSGLQPR